MHIDVITIFPGMLDGFIRESMLKRATDLNCCSISTVDLRDFTHDKRRTTDDRPFGGGVGMVMKPEPLFEAVEALKTPTSKVIMMSPRGKTFEQSDAQRLSQEQHLIFICGHYEGIDERVREALVDEELSVGDYVLTNGVLPAAIVVDATVRLLPGVLGGEGATRDESFQEGLLEYPHYTRPAEYRGMKVPDVLMSGHHGEVARWRQEKSLELTKQRRPDLLRNKE